ncbi:MAG: crossover junction endodeoxyribonuclease RuvC [Candidatus Kerfeldbacteria bacterium]|nr:crossover junction endodeoxyribonuclease RuvC [Candidatus Kerfeldbacteria bacterium]
MLPTSTATRSSRRRVLGIDPGLARFGWAVLEDSAPPKMVAADCLLTAAGQPEAHRLGQLFRALSAIIRRFRPQVMAVEELYVTKNISTVVAVGQARGVALAVAAMTRTPVVGFSPTAVKQAVTGYGRADKRQVARMVTLLLKLKRQPRLDDVADAMAVAWCGLPGVVLR